MRYFDNLFPQHFGHWDILVICLTVVSKLTEAMFISFNVQIFRPKWLDLIFFGYFENISVYDRKTTAYTGLQQCSVKTPTPTGQNSGKATIRSNNLIQASIKSSDANVQNFVYTAAYMVRKDLRTTRVAVSGGNVRLRLNITWMKFGCQQFCSCSTVNQWKSWYTARIICFDKSFKRNCNISTSMS